MKVVDFTDEKWETCKDECDDNPWIGVVEEGLARCHAEKLWGDWECQ